MLDPTSSSLGSALAAGVELHFVIVGPCARCFTPIISLSNHVCKQVLASLLVYAMGYAAVD